MPQSAVTCHPQRLPVTPAWALSVVFFFFSFCLFNLLNFLHVFAAPQTWFTKISVEQFHTEQWWKFPTSAPPPPGANLQTAPSAEQLSNHPLSHQKADDFFTFISNCEGWRYCPLIALQCLRHEHLSYSDSKRCQIEAIFTLLHRAPSGQEVHSRTCDHIFLRRPEIKHLITSEDCFFALSLYILQLPFVWGRIGAGRISELFIFSLLCCGTAGFLTERNFYFFALLPSPSADGVWSFRLTKPLPFAVPCYMCTPYL